MKNLIKAEWFKLSKSFGFKVLLLFNAASLFSNIFLLMAGAKGEGYKMFAIALTYILHHSVIGYLFSALYLSSEFSGRTFGTSLLCGCSRRKIFLSKALVFLAGLIILFLVYVGVSTTVISVGNGFGMEFSAKTCKEILLMLLCGMLACITMGAVILLVTVIVKKAVAAIGAGIIITYSLLWLEANFSENLVFLKYTYSYQMGQLEFFGEGFSPVVFLGVMVVTFLLAFAAAGFIFERTELK